jgi:hypothetical protein
LDEGGVGLFFDPEVLGWLEVISEDRDDLLDLVITIQIYKEIDR